MTWITITVGECEFEFKSKDDWVNKGPEIWRRHHLRDTNALCVDAAGRVCEMGLHFERAEKDGTYPIKVYRKNPRPQQLTSG